MKRPRLTERRKSGLRTILDVLENLRAEASESEGDISQGDKFVPNVQAAIDYIEALLQCAKT